MGVCANSGELVFLQMDGDLSPDEFQVAWDYNMGAIAPVHEIMIDALKRSNGGGE